MTHCDFPAGHRGPCSGSTSRMAGRRERQAAEYWTTAGFPSRCPSCDDRIRIEDRIGLVNGEWLCERCVS